MSSSSDDGSLDPLAPTDPLEPLSSSALKLLSVVLLLSFTYIVNNIAHRAHLPVPEAIITVVVGIIAGAVVVFSPNSLSFVDILKFEDVESLQFMLVFIAPIIFAEGYGMKSRLFFNNLPRILAHAFVGTVMSTIIVGVMIFNLAPLTGFDSHITLAECLTFGALISATDPVTTLVIFKQQGLVEKGVSHLYFSVLGESILNDAVGITLFEGFGDFVKANEEITLYKIDVMAAKFAVTFIGSMLVGVGCGILTALILRLVRMGDEEKEGDHHGGHFNIAETLLMLGLCYAPFLIATAITPLSGIVAVLFGGITARHYAHYNLTAQTREMFLPIVELFATNCETYTFLLVGMGVFSQQGRYNVSLIMWTVFACLVGRACQVYPLAITVNRMSNARRFTIPEMHICWLAGLRGAIAFMCSLSFPQNATSQNRSYMISTTIVIVFASMITLGWPTSWFLKVLRVGEAGAGDERCGSGDERRGSATQLVRLHSGEADEGREGTARASRLASLDIALMKLVMTPRAIEERKGAQSEARKRHEEIKRRLTVASSGADASADISMPLSPRGAASGAHRQGASSGMEVEMTETTQP